jgi:hypothetical protein
MCEHGEENRVDQAVFCSFVSSQNVTNTDVAESSPILIKMERKDQEKMGLMQPGRRDFKSGSAVGIQSHPGSQG